MKKRNRFFYTNISENQLPFSISENAKLETKIAEDSKKINDMRSGVKNLMDRFMEEKAKHKKEIEELQSRLDLLTSDS